MNQLSENSLPAIIFEHACKHEYKNTITYILENEEMNSQIISNATSNTTVKPLFIFTVMLKRLYSSSLFVKADAIPEELCQILPTFIELIEVTYRQSNFLSLKKYFTLVSELKLLDLLSLIVKNLDSSSILQKLNQYFPRWTSVFKANMEKDFGIINSKILDKVEESHTQCRKLILKLAIDLNYRMKYLSEQYSNDIERIIMESKVFIKEAYNVLQLAAGSSSLEKMIESGENVSDVKDLRAQLLLEYIEPQISDESLVKFLEDVEPTVNAQQTSGLASCLLPFDSMSEDEDSDLSESEYELSQSSSKNS